MGPLLLARLLLQRLAAHEPRRPLMKRALLCTSFSFSLLACGSPGPADSSDPGVPAPGPTASLGQPLWTSVGLAYNRSLRPLGSGEHAPHVADFDGDGLDDVALTDFAS